MIMLLVGGTDTFPKVFANLALRLFQHPDQRARVAADPALAPDAFNEGLRIDMPTQFLGRTLTREVEFHGQRLAAGQLVIFLYASANRDEREFEEPDRFDVARRPPRTLGFGHGTHACLGIHVAKAEGRIGLTELLARAPDYEIDLARAVRHRTEFVQGFASLPVRFLARMIGAPNGAAGARVVASPPWQPPIPSPASPSIDYPIVDADAHVYEPPDVWQARCPAKWKERAPKLVKTEEGDVWPFDDGKRDLAGRPHGGGRPELLPDSGRWASPTRRCARAASTPRRASPTWTPTASTRRCSTRR